MDGHFEYERAAQVKVFPHLQHGTFSKRLGRLAHIYSPLLAGLFKMSMQLQACRTSTYVNRKSAERSRKFRKSGRPAVNC
jgi:TctA family transporter